MYKRVACSLESLQILHEAMCEIRDRGVARVSKSAHSRNHAGDGSSCSWHLCCREIDRLTVDSTHHERQARDGRRDDLGVGAVETCSNQRDAVGLDNQVPIAWIDTTVTEASDTECNLQRDQEETVSRRS